MYSLDKLLNSNVVNTILGYLLGITSTYITAHLLNKNINVEGYRQLEQCLIDINNDINEICNLDNFIYMSRSFDYNKKYYNNKGNLSSILMSHDYQYALNVLSNQNIQKYRSHLRKLYDCTFQIKYKDSKIIVIINKYFQILINELIKCSETSDESNYKFYLDNIEFDLNKIDDKEFNIDDLYHNIEILKKRVQKLLN